MTSTEEPVLREIDYNEFATKFTADVSKKNFTPLTSYNWIDSTKPTIYVPGSPPTWTPKAPGTKVPADTGLVMIDQNAYRNPQHPLEPLFRALFTQHPSFTTTSADLITDRNNLRKLLRFVCGETQKAFKIGVQRVGGTTMFTRMERQSSEVLVGFRGFGFGFERAYTTWPVGLEGSVGHNRVVGYEIGGLRCVVRFEMDAWMSVEGDVGSGVVGGGGEQQIVESGVGVVRKGRLVSQEGVVEIKTRAQSKALDMKDVLPQLWFSGTPWLTVAYHRGGRFDNINTMKMDDGKLEEWEKGNAEGLGKMVELIKIIMEEAGRAEGGCCMVYGEGGKLTIKGTAVKDCLPEDLMGGFVST